jgi:hypothetical protein
MKARFHNANIDVTIEGKTRSDILDKFQRDYKEESGNVIFIEWEE